VLKPVHQRDVHLVGVELRAGFCGVGLVIGCEERTRRAGG
jgi:hypothetical protein